jgi:hypothetical protein
MSEASSASTLTLFATPKRFQGHIGNIQRNAIASWARLNPRPEIILFGTDDGTAEAAREFDLRHVPSIKTNQWGTPLVSDLFQQAETVGKGSALCYVNADIVLFDDFPRAIERVSAWSDRFLMVGRRTDLEITDPLAFDHNWDTNLRHRAQQEGKPQIARSIDYFAFSRGLYPSMPALAIGRFWWDNWLLWKARSAGAKVVDASKAVMVIHQNHDYSHTTYGSSKEEMMASDECMLNARLTCEQNPGDYDNGFFWRYAYTIDDATYKLTREGVSGNPRHVWKQFKRYSSRPLGMAKLTLRALFSFPQSPPDRSAADRQTTAEVSNPDCPIK